MALLVFDTHDFITKLTEAGMVKEHAIALSDGLKTLQLENVATRADLVDLRTEISELRTEVHTLRADMLGMKGSLLQWFTGMLLGQAALVATLVKLLG